LEVLGAIDIARLPDLYRSATVVACPSLAEGAAPLALLEAMDTGRAVVASSIPQHLEVGPDAGVLFVPPGDVDATGRALRNHLDDAAGRAGAGRAARRKVEGEYSLTVM